MEHPQSYPHEIHNLNRKKEKAMYSISLLFILTFLRSSLSFVRLHQIFIIYYYLNFLFAYLQLQRCHVQNQKKTFKLLSGNSFSQLDQVPFLYFPCNFLRRCLHILSLCSTVKAMNIFMCILAIVRKILMKNTNNCSDETSINPNR